MLTTDKPWGLQSSAKGMTGGGGSEGLGFDLGLDLGGFRGTGLDLDLDLSLEGEETLNLGLG